MANVLIVDANPTSRLLLADLLEQAGFTVFPVAHAASAVDRLRRSDEALVVVARQAEPDIATRQELATAAAPPRRALLWVATSLRRDAQPEESGEMTVPLDVPVLLAAISRAAQRVDAMAVAAQQRPEPPEVHLAG